MFCSNCGHELPEGTKFCPECGTPSGDGTSGAVSMGDARDIQHRPAAAAGRRPAGLAVAACVMALLAVVCVGVFVAGANPFGSPAPEEPVAQEGEGTEQEEPAKQEPADSELEFTAQDDERSKADGEDAAEKDEQPADENSSSNEKDDPEAPVSGDYMLPGSDSHVYTAQELSGMSDWELYIARNEIYARHGRCFNNDDLQSYFDGKSWYSRQTSPEAFDQRAGQLLNATELKNAETILAVEQARGSAYI